MPNSHRRAVPRAGSNLATDPQRRGERLGRQIRRELRIARRRAEEPQHRALVALIERPERRPFLARLREQRVVTGGRVGIHHPSYWRGPADL